MESKISLQMYTLREYTKTWEGLTKTVEALAKIGFQTLQYSIPAQYDADEVAKLFAHFGIQNDSVFCKGLELDEKMGEVLAQCERFDTDYVRVDSIPKSLAESAGGYRMYAEHLNRVCVPMKAEGRKLLYHFHAFEFHRFGDKSGIEILLEETDPAVIQIIPDTHWIQAGGKDILGFFEKYKDRFDYIHTKDYGIVGRTDKMEQTLSCFAPVGDGNIEWEPIIKWCKAKGVKSYAIEQDQCYGADEFECVRRSFNKLKALGVDDK